MTNQAEQELARYVANAKHLEDAHAYAPDQEHDACGVGLVAAIDGKPRREVVLHAISALKCVWHRGAVDADGKTGDGAGIHVQIPHDFFREHIKRTGHQPRPGQLAVGMIFLPRTDLDGQERCRSIVEAEILNLGYVIYGWRQVPVNIDVIGEKDLAVTKWGTLKIDHRTMMTSVPGVFAAGDIVRGASLVVWAIRDGRDVAEHMHRYLEANPARALRAAAE